MKRSILFLSIFLIVQSVVISNPIDSTPIAKISELIFDENDNWTMEIFFPFGYWGEITDSIVLINSKSSARLLTTYSYGTTVAVITSDSLSLPFSINRTGDSITIVTYSKLNLVPDTRETQLIFGDCPGATVGKPVNGYSIYCIYDEYYDNPLQINFLTKNPSPGIINTITGQTGTMQGKIYDMNGNLIKRLIPFAAGRWYFHFQTPLYIDSTGSYTTNIFNTIFNPGLLYVKIFYFPIFEDTMEIEPFSLEDIKPDTIVIQDIHLKSQCNNCDIVNAIEQNFPSQPDEFRLINYPNPFNSSTNFFIKIPSSAKGKQSEINIYDTNGRLVKNIPVESSLTINWDGKDMSGATLSSGIYFYYLDVGNQVIKSGSMILLK